MATKAQKFYLLPYADWPEEEKEKKRKYARDWKDNPENKLRNYKTSLKRLYSLTWEDYITLLESQQYCCAICNKKLDIPGQGIYNGNNTAVLDHDHVTNKVRGILCRGCNKALGTFKDNADLVYSAYLYLKGK